VLVNKTNTLFLFEVFYNMMVYFISQASFKL